LGDINKTLLTGVAETRPVLTHLPHTNTSLCYFTLRVEERFVSAKNITHIRPNYIRIESLGRQASEVFDKVKVGARFLIDGYLRQDNKESDGCDLVKVRSYGVIADPTMESHNYNMGLRRALAILSTTKDPIEASKAIEEAMIID